MLPADLPMFRPAVYCYQSCTRVHHGPVAQLVSAPPCHGGGRGFKSRQGRWLVFQPSGAVAQSVERPPEKWKVTSSILVRATTKPQQQCWGFSLVDAPTGGRFSALGVVKLKIMRYSTPQIEPARIAWGVRPASPSRRTSAWGSSWAAPTPQPADSTWR